MHYVIYVHIYTYKYLQVKKKILYIFDIIIKKELYNIIVTFNVQCTNL